MSKRSTNPRSARNAVSVKTSGRTSGYDSENNPPVRAKLMTRTVPQRHHSQRSIRARLSSVWERELSKLNYVHLGRYNWQRLTLARSLSRSVRVSMNTKVRAASRSVDRSVAERRENRWGGQFIDLRE